MRKLNKAMRFPIRLIPAGTQVDFAKQRTLAAALSLLLVAASVLLLTLRGLEFGIDFSGGLLMEIQAGEPLELGPLRQELTGGELGQVSLQHFGDARSVLIRAQADESTDQAALIAAIKDKLARVVEGPLDYRRSEFVGPTVGHELIGAGVKALCFAVLAILVYIWFRFEWQFGVGAVVALVHDTLLTLGFYVLAGIEFNLTSIAAILTIIGYSINDTVVIYDRIRENVRRYRKSPLSDIINRSLNETLARTILTAGTTALALVALSVLGGEVIRGFSLAILFGVVVGTYSSIYIAAPVLLRFNLRPSEMMAEEDAAAGRA